ncbi:MAG: zinc ribbon domain-containing protein, partial [Clostridia bacterium]|nr:zinc ribbon domain-containing protein [Clostridia bacterium]
MKCTKCGAENGAEVKYCVQCGSFLRENAPYFQKTVVGGSEYSYEQIVQIGRETYKPQPPRGKKAMLVWGWILAGLGFCYLFFYGLGLLFAIPAVILLKKGYAMKTTDTRSDYDYYQLGLSILSRGKEIVLNKEAKEIMYVNPETWTFQFKSGKNLSQVYSYQEINLFEIKQDNQVVTRTASSGGLAGMAIGGLLGGGAGMIAGAIASKASSSGKQVTATQHQYTLIITFKNLSSKVVTLDNLNIAVEVNNVLDLYNKFLVKQNGGTPATEEKEAESTETYDTQMKSYDVLLKYKKLLDENIITKEEFEEKKKE